MGPLDQVLQTRRTIRRFCDRPIAREDMKQLLDVARLAPSGANLQPLHYIAVLSKEKCEEIFPQTAWAGYVKPYGTPPEGQRPRAYVVVLADTQIRKAGFDFDAGAAVENLVLSAWEKGIGSCIIGACNRDEIRKILDIEEKDHICCLVALGYPAHECSCYDTEDGDIHYTMDENGNFRVPKRTLRDITKWVE